MPCDCPPAGAWLPCALDVALARVWFIPACDVPSDRGEWPACPPDDDVRAVA
ncbi:MAG: hypothetical protein AVDCRST_MAG89-5233 [uncultured Gemmatimonadetes bacterium]|uniref:Uncharacterized protein n=1 Tax=uncultured Gemmatimonadota bacterium TaxID=203437 RepID=A0A6J4N603_9BACT|nr:MAG: hypothetical protein AVDCRST_MAG89-5233 [uncultured Gemmatimonadota bacterium]